MDKLDMIMSAFEVEKSADDKSADIDTKEVEQKQKDDFKVADKVEVTQKTMEEIVDEQTESKNEESEE